MTPYRILSMDGGGIRGILTARVMERVDEVVPGFLNRVDLLAGTSTGGLLALGLASGMTPKTLRTMYQELADHVFADSLLDDVRDLGNLIGAQYSIEPLKGVLETYFPGTRLGDLPKRVVIATFDLDNEGQGFPGFRTWKMKFFHNYPGPDSDADQLVVNVALRTSVAPAYFPVYQGYIDGGVAASSPAMCALAQALHRSTGGQTLDNIRLLSMGTGYNPRHLDTQNADWGLAQWAPHLIYIMLEGSVGMVDYQCRQILEEKYFRMDPVLPIYIDLGDIQYIPELLSTADQVDLDGMSAWLKHNF